jgi:putative Holliday junction resolvase
MAVLPPRGALIAVDLSPRRLGLAATDPERLLATPLRTLARRRLRLDLETLRVIAAERAAAGWVIGWPLNMSGSAGPACDRVRSFVAALVSVHPLPILLQDERLTSEAAAEAVAEGRFGRTRAGEPIDHIAAAILLEDALRAAARPLPGLRRADTA